MPAEIAQNPNRLRQSRRALADQMTLGILRMDNSTRILSKEVLVPLGLVGAVAAAAGAVGSWVAVVTYGHRTDLRLQGIETQVSSLHQRVMTDGADRWTGRDMRIWSELLRAKNPELSVPDLGD